MSQSGETQLYKMLLDAGYPTPGLFNMEIPVGPRDGRGVNPGNPVTKHVIVVCVCVRMCQSRQATRK